MENLPKPGEVVKVKLYVQLDENNKVCVNDYDASNFTYSPHIPLGEFETEFIMPDTSVTGAKIELLRNKIEQLNKEHFAKVKNLEDQVQELLCIGHDGGAE